MSKKKKEYSIKDIEKVTEGLVEVFEKLKNGTIELKAATVINKTAGNIIRGFIAQLVYHKSKKEKPTKLKGR